MGEGIFLQLDQTTVKPKSLYIYLLLTGIIFVSFNLRPAITSVGPLIGMIQDDIGLAHWSTGILTSLPLICFAFMSPIAPKISFRLTNEWTLLLGLVVLFIGILIRSITMTFFLFTGTFLIGIGIAVCNVILPVIIKEKFPLKFGLLTSVYSTSMTLFAALASGFSVPLANGLNLGWQKSLFIWGIPTIAAIIIWMYLVKGNKGQQAKIKSTRTGSNRMWRSLLAWQVALYMGFQSFLFYVTMTWLPQILQYQGVDITTSGWLLSFSQFIGVPIGFIVPVLAGRFRKQSWMVVVLGVFSLLGLGGLFLHSSYPIMITSIIFLGIGLGGTFPLCLALLGLRCKDARQAAELSGMAQSVGYILAAAGPMLIGYLYDFTHAWSAPLITMMIVGCLLILFGIGAGRDKFV